MPHISEMDEIESVKRKRNNSADMDANGDSDDEEEDDDEEDIDDDIVIDEPPIADLEALDVDNPFDDDLDERNDHDD